MKYREAAVAGRFYPGEAIVLRQQMAEYFAGQPVWSMVPKALVVPHAGYFFSGEVAAKAYSLMANAERSFSRVVLLGPSHHVALEGCAVPASDVFITPMGEVELDRQWVDTLLAQELVLESEQAHHWEHSLEVQLPFLQYCLDDFTLLPLVVGRCKPDVITQVLALVAQQPDTLIVVSSDLSHYHPYSDANVIDANTIANVLDYGTAIQPEQACGCFALNGLLNYAKGQHWKIKCVSHTNSGDVMAQHEHRSPSNSEEVVGYASFVLY